jgi:hypothetical protein
VLGNKQRPVAGEDSGAGPCDILALTTAKSDLGLGQLGSQLSSPGFSPGMLLPGEFTVKPQFLNVPHVRVMTTSDPAHSWGTKPSRPLCGTRTVP